MQRRQFTALIGAAALAATLPVRGARAQAKPRIIVVGGGAAGAATARYLARDSNDTLDITLIEPNASYEFTSNLPLLGLRADEDMTRPYTALAALPGLTLLHDRVIGIEREKKRVRTGAGASLAYDRLVLAPGLELDYTGLAGWSRDAAGQMPHAMKGAAQMELLLRGIDGMPDGGLVVITAAAGLQSAPFAPYERASLIAARLKASGRHNARVLVLDEKPVMPLRDLFMAGWLQHYRGMVTWQPPAEHGGLRAVVPDGMRVVTGNGEIAAQLVNVMPRQMVGELARSAKLTDLTGVVQVDPFTLKSREDPAIYVLGDAASVGAMSRSAHAARSQAAVVAMQLRGELAGARTYPARYEDVVWPLLAPDDGLRDGGTLEPAEDGIQLAASLVARAGDPPEQRRANAAAALAFREEMARDIFG